MGNIPRRQENAGISGDNYALSKERKQVVPSDLASVDHTSKAYYRDKELFDYYTDRHVAHKDAAEMEQYLRNVQTFLGSRVLEMAKFLGEHGLFYRFVWEKYPEQRNLEMEKMIRDVLWDKGRADMTEVHKTPKRKG